MRSKMMRPVREEREERGSWFIFLHGKEEIGRTPVLPKHLRHNDDTRQQLPYFSTIILQYTSS
eukprot:scaffold25353_cov78-Skeletonema_dohrnii-CCMP3373.AAC.2